MKNDVWRPNYYEVTSAVLDVCNSAKRAYVDGTCGGFFVLYKNKFMQT